jgi:hypothetical protein
MQGSLKLRNGFLFSHKGNPWCLIHPIFKEDAQDLQDDVEQTAGRHE